MRLEQYGFTEVYDYALGKSDWLAFDLPYEGEAVLAGGAAQRDVPTCGEGDPVAALRAGIDASPVGAVVVVNEAGVVLGVVVDEDAEAHPEAVAGEVMIEGPTTVRPSEDLEMLRHRMQHAGVPAVLVTSPDGVLLGAVRA